MTDTRFIDDLQRVIDEYNDACSCGFQPVKRYRTQPRRVKCKHWKRFSERVRQVLRAHGVNKKKKKRKPKLKPKPKPLWRLTVDGVLVEEFRATFAEACERQQAVNGRESKLERV